MSCYTDWLDALAAMHSPRVLEIGTKDWHGNNSHRDIVMATNTKAQWDGLDIEPGLGVTIVCDIHEVSELVAPDTYDAILCTSVLEHVRRPWVAAEQLASITKPGGLLMIQTHQTFPYHGYPHDYFRFSREGLAELFCKEIGWSVVSSEYEFPCIVVPRQNAWTHCKDWNFEAEAWLNVCAVVARVKRG